MIIKVLFFINKLSLTLLTKIFNNYKLYIHKYYMGNTLGALDKNKRKISVNRF